MLTTKKFILTPIILCVIIKVQGALQMYEEAQAVPTLTSSDIMHLKQIYDFFR